MVRTRKPSNAKAVFAAAKAADTTTERYGHTYDEDTRRKPSRLPTSLDELKAKLGEVVQWGDDD